MCQEPPIPRQSGIDAPGALHHIIARGIGRRNIFDDDRDRNDFLERLGTALTETGTACFAWALIPNHFHLLVRTGQTHVATVMRRLLTGYAIGYNHRHRRHGHLFQNRYKSILCEEEPYFLELVRYVHLNPLRAGMVEDLAGLDTYRYAGHSVLMGNSGNSFQDIGSVLQRFARRAGTARKRYRSFVQEGIEMGRRPELTGGGLIRSMGGWATVRALRRAETYMKGDERILGDGDFVNAVLAKAEEHYEQRYRLASMGLTVDDIAVRVAQLMQLPVEQVWLPGKRRVVVQARSLLCFWSVRDLGVSMTALARKLGISCTAVSQSMIRGEQIARLNNYRLTDQL